MYIKWTAHIVWCREFSSSRYPWCNCLLLDESDLTQQYNIQKEIACYDSSNKFIHDWPLLVSFYTIDRSSTIVWMSCIWYYSLYIFTFKWPQAWILSACLELCCVGWESRLNMIFHKLHCVAYATHTLHSKHGLSLKKLIILSTFFSASIDHWSNDSSFKIQPVNIPCNVNNYFTRWWHIIILLLIYKDNNCTSINCLSRWSNLTN